MADEKFASAIVELRVGTDKLKQDFANVQNDVKKTATKIETDFKSVKLDFDNRFATMKLSEVKKNYELLKSQMGQKLNFNASDSSIEKTAIGLDSARARMKDLASESDKTTSHMKSGFERVAERLVEFFALREIVRYLKDMVTEAMKFEEISSYFKGSAQDMTNFRNATKGTVSDMGLEKLSNQSYDLGISLKEQPLLFALAKRAAEAYGTDTEAGFQKVVMATEGNIRDFVLLVYKRKSMNK